MKRVLASILAIALIFGMMSITVFAEDSSSTVGEWVTQYAQNGKVTDPGINSAYISITAEQGGKIRRLDLDEHQNVFPCGNGDWGWSTWNFEVKPDHGYEFVGWTTRVDWQFYNMDSKWVWEHYWQQLSNPNPGNFGGHAHHNAGKAFTINGTFLNVNHVVCNQFPRHKDVRYIAVANFRKIVPTLTVNHYVKTVNQFGDIVEAERIAQTDMPDVSALAENAVLGSQTYKVDLGEYKYDTTKETSVNMALGANTLNIYYVKKIYVDQPATITVKDTGLVLNAKGDVIKTLDLGTRPSTGNYLEKQVVKQSDVQNKGGYGDYQFNAEKNTIDKTLVAGENSMEVFYTRVARTVPIKVKQIGITLNSAGKETERKTLGTEVIRETYREGDVITSNQVKKVDKIDYFQYDSSRDETLKIPFYPDNLNSVKSDVEELAAMRNSINVYYVYKIIPVTPTEPTPPTPPTPPEIVPDEVVPLAPPTKIPQTGDNTPFVPLLVLVTLAGAVFGIAKIKVQKVK